MMNARRFRLSIVLVLGHLSAVSAGFAQDSDTVKPVPREGNWTMRHDAINARAKQGDVDLLFLGDSITQGWGKQEVMDEVWQKFYGKRKAMNAGIGGDRTQHVLWRLDHGNIDGIKPKVAVLMIGTNNSNSNTAEEIGAGITAIVKKLREKLPDTKVLILAIFPRGAVAGDEQVKVTREKNAQASAIAAKLADGKMVHYLDIGKSFLEPDGNLSKEIMPDALHLSVKGYQIWAEAIEAKVAELLGEKK